jgi:hypothetical protein
VTGYPEPQVETFTQPKITGYRQLTEAEASDMNAIKAHGAGLELLLDELAKNPDYDKRWAAIARTELQQGLMAFTRSVARPTSF